MTEANVTCMQNKLFHSTSCLHSELQNK